MKKILSLILAVLLLLSFAACAKDDSPAGETTGDPSGNEQGNPDRVDLSGYTVVVSETATNAVKRLSKSLVDTVKEKTGVNLTRVNDNTKKNKATAKEILFGLSNREETKTALDGLGTTGYSISFSGEKLVIVASNDYMLERALGALCETHLTFEGKSVGASKTLNVIYDGSAEMSLLVDEEGNFRYQILYPDANANDERALADAFRLDLQQALSCNVPLVRTDASVEAKDDAYELLIGKTNRSQSTKLYESIKVSEVMAAIDGNKIVIGAGTESNLDKAIATFLSGMQELGKGIYDGRYVIYNEYGFTETVSEWLNGVSLMEKGTYIGCNDVGDDSLVYVWEDTAKTDYEAYLSTLKAGGFTEKETYSLGENSYMLLESDAAYAYASYIPAKEMVRLFVEDKAKGTAYPSAEQAEYDTYDGYEPTLWQVECDWKTALEWDTSLPEGSRGSNCGMCYVLKVADGSFVIFDSGMNSVKQADIIYEHLTANTDAEKPVISAWFFSHAHADHTGGFQQFTAKYKDQVTVKAFYHNFPAKGFGLEDNHTGDTKMLNLMKQYSGAKIYRKLHSGMSFYVADARFDVLYAHEDLYPTVMEGDSLNEASTVIRVTFGGQRIMILGDAQVEVGNTMLETLPKSELECDIVQYSHHGWDGPTKEFYDAVEAPTVLWPNAIYSWQKGAEEENIFNRLINTSDGAYFYKVNYYIAHEATYVKTIIVNAEGTGTQKLTLPYTPRAERLPDYEAIYNEIKAKEDALKQEQGEE